MTLWVIPGRASHRLPRPDFIQYLPRLALAGAAVSGHKRRFRRASVASALPSIATKSVRATNAVSGHKRTHAPQQKIATRSPRRHY